MTIIERILRELEVKGLKKSDLANHLHKSNWQISMWESRNSNPPAELIPAIADFLSISTDYILRGKENKKTEPTILAYSGNERIDSIAKEILKTDLSEDDLKLIEFILDKYKK